MGRKRSSGSGKVSLLALTLACTFAAALFGFGSEVFAFRSVYEGTGREGLILTTRLIVYLTLNGGGRQGYSIRSTRTPCSRRCSVRACRKR